MPENLANKELIALSVPLSAPPIPMIPLLVDQLNKTRDLFAFIRAIRAEFQALVEGNVRL